MGKQLTTEELKALKSVGVIAENWYAVQYDETQMPFALFASYEHAKAYRDQFIATAIIEPWPMVIKDYRKRADF